MVNIAKLLIEHMDIWTAAETEKKSGRGRASGNPGSVYGVKKLRELILELAVRGKLVPQDPNDEPASELLKRIQAEKAKLIAEGKLKKEKPLAPVSSDEKPFELSQGWVWARLGDTGRIFNGNSINENEKLDKYRSLKTGYPFIATKDVGYGRDELEYQNGVLIPFEENSLKVAHKGAVLICAEGGSAGKKIGITSQDICFGNKLFANELSAEIEPFYIFHLYQSVTFYSLFQQKMTGIIGGISLNEFLSIPIPLPSLKEQRRIVAKVDELMALCDQLEQQHSSAQQAHETLVSQLLATLTQSQNVVEFNANWQRIYAYFDVLFTTEVSIDALKKTLLQLAVMGKLVQQDINDEPATELLKRIQAEKTKLIAEGKLKKEKPLAPISGDEKPFELPKGWEWVRFGAINAIKAELVRPEDYQDFRQVAPDCIEKGSGRLTEFRTVKEAEVRGPNSRFYKGQIIYSKIRPSLSKAVLVDFDGLCSADMYPIDAFIDSAFMLKLILSEHFLVQVRIAENRIKMPKLNQESLTAFVLPLPPLAEQHRIVVKVDALMVLCDQLKSRIHQANQQQQTIADALVTQALKPVSAEIIDLASYRAAIGCYAIKKMQSERYFGRTAAMKMFYLSEVHLGLAMNLRPVRKQAGPFDDCIYDFEMLGEQAGWFKVIKTPLRNGKTKVEYQTKPAIAQKSNLIETICSVDQRKEFDRLLGLFADKSTEEAEIIATLFAAWNDFLIDGQTPNDEQIVQEVRENWHESKARFTPEQLKKSLGWMRRNQLVPQGRLPHTLHQQRLKLH